MTAPALHAGGRRFELPRSLLYLQVPRADDTASAEHSLREPVIRIRHPRAPETRVRLLGGHRQRVDERRELVLEILDSADTPALGQLDRHRVGEDLLFTTLDAVEDPLRDR